MRRLLLSIHRPLWSTPLGVRSPPRLLLTPSGSYLGTADLTLLDAYILSVSGVLLLCAVQNAVLGLRSREDDTLLLSAAADYGSTLGLLAVWLLLQLYYGCKLCSAMQRRREVVGNETADEADQMRTPMTRVLTKNLQIDAKKDVQQAV